MTAAFLHIANLLLLCSFLVRDIFFLRLISILASILFSVYFYAQAPPMWTAMAWNLVFVAVNVFQISQLLYRRRKIPLGAHEQMLQSHLFPRLPARDIRTLFQLANPLRLTNGCMIQDCISIRSNLIFILNGSASDQTGTKNPGDILGVEGYISPVEVRCDAVAEGDLHCLSWTHESIRDWSQGEPERRSQLMLVFSQSLAKALQSEPSTVP